MAEQNQQLLEKISLNKKEVADLLKKDKKQTETLNILLTILGQAKVTEADRKLGSLYFSAANQFQKTQLPAEYYAVISEYISTEKITAIPRLDLAFQFLKKLKKDEKLDNTKLDDFIGVGVVVTLQDIEKAIDALFEEKKSELDALRYGVNQVGYRNEIQARLRFPNPKELFETFKSKLEARLGKETAEEKQARMDKNKKDAKPKKEAKKEEKKEEEKPNNGKKYDISNLVARDLATSVNSQDNLKWKTDRFGDKLMSRFPPEPNGYLHLGHCKAINFNFSLAEEYQGHCYLRFDDTNPEKENIEYINSIKSGIEWLGFKPFKVTASSDNFDFLYECAIKLINKGSAFVCGQSKEEGKHYRDNDLPSPYRDQSVEENLRLFNNMKLGLYKEGEYCLRAKIDYKSKNTTLKDPAIYRIRFTPHPHSGDKWCIYPLYDFTHPICDSVEGITHSCCTLEFEIRRELYYWVLSELDLYRPYQWEYSRLNLTNSVLSKRKNQELIDKGFVFGWNDPRLHTIEGMKRRGYTPKGIRNFVDELGVNRTSNDAFVPMHRLEDKVRDDLDNIAVRTLAVIDPVVVNITNLANDYVKEIKAQDFPKLGKESPVHIIQGRNKVYVERSDVLHRAHKDFFGIAPGTLTGLKYFGVFRCNEVKRDSNGEVTEVNVEYVHDGTDKTQKPKTFVNWVAAEESQVCEIRLYDNLFSEEFPTKYQGNFLDTVNKNNLVVMPNARMNKTLKLNLLDKYQFERQGFFCVDYDSDLKNNKIVWNRTVKLIEKDRSGAMKKVLEEIAKLDAEEAAKK